MVSNWRRVEARGAAGHPIVPGKVATTENDPITPRMRHVVLSKEGGDRAAQRLHLSGFGKSGTRQASLQGAFLKAAGNWTGGAAMPTCGRPEDPRPGPPHRPGRRGWTVSAPSDNPGRSGLLQRAVPFLLLHRVTLSLLPRV